MNFSNDILSLIDKLPDTRGREFYGTYTQKDKSKLIKWNPLSRVQFELESLREVIINGSRSYLSIFLKSFFSNQIFEFKRNIFYQDKLPEEYKDEFSEDKQKYSGSSSNINIVSSIVTRENFMEFCQLFPTLAYMCASQNSESGTRFMLAILETGQDYLLDIDNKADTYNKEKSVFGKEENKKENTDFIPYSRLPILSLTKNQLMSIMSQPLTKKNREYVKHILPNIFDKSECILGSYKDIMTIYELLIIDKEKINIMDIMKELFETREIKLTGITPSKIVSDTGELLLKIGPSLVMKALLNFDIDTALLLSQTQEIETYIPGSLEFTTLKWYADTHPSNIKAKKAYDTLCSLYKHIEYGIMKLGDHSWITTTILNQNKKEGNGNGNGNVEENNGNPFYFGSVQTQNPSNIIFNSEYDLLVEAIKNRNMDLIKFILITIMDNINQNKEKYREEIKEEKRIKEEKKKQEKEKQRKSEDWLSGFSSSFSSSFNKSMKDSIPTPSSDPIFKVYIRSYSILYYHILLSSDSLIKLSVSLGYDEITQYLVERIVELQLYYKSELLSEKGFSYEYDLLVNNPLHMAAKYGHVDLCKILIDKYNYSINDVDGIGRTPLMYACMLTHDQYPHNPDWMDISDDIMENQTYPKSSILSSTNNYTLSYKEMHELIIIDTHTLTQVPPSAGEVVKLLLDYGSDAHLKDICGLSPLGYLTHTWASWRINRCPDLNKVNWKPFRDILHLLIKEKVDLDEKHPFFNPTKLPFTRRKGEEIEGYSPDMTIVIALAGCSDIEVNNILELGVNPFTSSNGLDIYLANINDIEGNYKNISSIKSSLIKYRNRYKKLHKDIDYSDYDNVSIDMPHLFNSVMSHTTSIHDILTLASNLIPALMPSSEDNLFLQEKDSISTTNIDKIIKEEEEKEEKSKKKMGIKEKESEEMETKDNLNILSTMGRLREMRKRNKEKK